jgi:hypothetical protein
MTLAITPTAPVQFTTSPAPQDPALKEIYANGVKVGYFSRMHANAWAGCYSATRAITAFDTADEAMDFVMSQHRAVLNLAKAVRAIRPATGASVSGAQTDWDGGYNDALRDVERVLRAAVGEAPHGEGYTATTR